MKQSKFFVLLLSGVICLSSCNSKIKYPSGKDTVMSFGDGTYQIGRGGNNLSMCYAPVGFCIIDHVTDVYEAETKVYIIGEYMAQKQEVFAVIDLEKNTLVLYEKLKTDNAKTYWKGSDLIEEGIITSLTSFYDFSQEDQAVFRDRGRFTSVK